MATVNNESLLIEIITPEEQVFKGKAKAILVPGEDGYIYILPSHLPLICSLKKGILTIYLEKGELKELNIAEGILELDKDNLKIITESALDKEEIKA